MIAGRYERVRLLGEGGMGQVYEAIDVQTQRRVAIKQLRVERRLPEELATRFSREILATAQITSKHVVTVHDAGIDEETGEPFMVMDYLEGEDLGAIADRLGTLPVETALPLVAQACDGLIAAHAVGIIHRDIKPSNLFLVAPNASGARIVKIVDFGIARIHLAGREVQPLTELTQTGAIIGSPLYMSPEQLRGVKRLDHRADVWSLGVVMYRLLSGTVPHESQSLADLLVTVCSQPAPPIRQRAPWLPIELASLVQRALSIDPDARIPSARAFAEELKRFLPDGTAVTDAMLVSRPGAKRDSAPAPAAAPVSVSVLEPPPRRVTPFVLLALLAITIAATVWLKMQRRAASPAEPAVPELPSTPGAAWFKNVRPRCTAIELRSLLADTPPPNTPDGAAFATACASLAGNLSLAHDLLYALPPEQRATASGPMFEFAHEIADRRNDDPMVRDIMRMVIDVWPDNYQALYAAGVVEFQQGDPLAGPHLRRFVQLFPNNAWAATAERLLAQLATPGRDCNPIRDPMGHPIAIPGCRK